MVMQSSETMSGLEALYFLAFAFLLVYVWKTRRFHYASFTMKGPPAIPLLGNCLEFLGSTEDILQSTARMVKSYGTPFRLWVGTRFLVGITNPEDFEVILNHPSALAKEELYRFLTDVTGDSIFSLKNVSRWRHHRKLLATTFNPRILNSFIPIFQEQSLILCEKLEDFVGKGIFDVYPLIAACTLDTVFETAMGTKVNIQLGNKEYMQWVDDACTIGYKRVFCVWYHFDFIFNRMKEGKRLRECIECLRNFNEKIIQAKRKEYKENKLLLSNEESSNKGRKAFLDNLIQIFEETQCYSDKELRDEVVTFIIGGSHSTSGTNSFALMLLGMHPKIQEKAFKEQQEIFANSARALTGEDLSRMKYLERVIKETLRLFPFSAIIGRSASDDIKLRSCTVPKGSGCILGIYHAHRDPKLWQDPLKFDPDRFFPEETLKRHPYSWIPFSAGPRNCIGLKYGMLSMKALLSTVLRKYKIHCHYKNVEEIRVKTDLSLKAVEGHKITLQFR